MCIWVILQYKFGSVVLRYVHTKWWLQTKFVEYYLFIGTAKYTKASPPAKKMLFSSIIITIILPNAMIRIYIILHIYLQVSQTEGGGGWLAELHWVIGQSLLEKLSDSWMFVRKTRDRKKILLANQYHCLGHLHLKVCSASFHSFKVKWGMRWIYLILALVFHLRIFFVSDFFRLKTKGTRFGSYFFSFEKSR